MARIEPEFADNTFVLKNAYGGNEYLSLFVKFERDEFDHVESYTPICLTRYCVPGRIDTYSFDWWDRPSGYGDAVAYFSERHTPLLQIMKMVQRDLDRPFVVRLMKEAGTKLKYYHLRQLIMFLKQLGPTSKSVKRLEAIAKSRQKQIKKEQQEREKSLTAENQCSGKVDLKLCNTCHTCTYYCNKHKCHRCWNDKKLVTSKKS